ncbi:alpha-ribazole phosphatase [Alkalispirochaeta americana]|uniref:Alpha-ribazole phosphatase n=1 Tax=Alkalispirochaeta americana TaxID=159291 RepID=A0A1N6PU35_9SPIO|nr:histidine phosphatase family protein [Alkalispirochaeta americana]SIQ07858.1 alpha-ribazole phosphatase [Alkalispirochaeta americana]
MNTPIHPRQDESPLLVAIRHTRVEKPPGMCLGRTPLPLAESYDQERKVILENLRKIPLAGAIIHTSPLERCRILAGDLGSALGYAVQEDPQLLEFDYGLWDGRPWEDIPREETHPWMENWQTHPTPGGESLPMMIERVRAFCADLPGDTPTLAVTHEGVLRCLEYLFAGSGAGAGLENFFERPLPFGVIRRYPLPLCCSSQAAPSRFSFHVER